MSFTEILREFYLASGNIETSIREATKFFISNKEEYLHLKSKYEDFITDFSWHDVDCTISVLNTNYEIYKNDEDILKKKNQITDKKTIVLLNHNKSLVFFDIDTKTQNDNKFFISNILAYKKFLILLKNGKLTDYESVTENKLLFISSNFGINKISYDTSNYLTLDESKDFFKDVEKFNNCLQKDDVFVGYLKNEVIKIIQNIDYKHQIDYILKNLNFIIDNTEKEFNIYLKKFSFDELRKNLITEKDAFFSNIRDLVGKIFTQIIAIPISITAFYISLQNINRINFVYVFTAFYILITLFALTIQISYFFDNKYIQFDFKKAFKKIEAESGLDHTIIKNEKDKIHYKIIFNYVLLILLVLITIFLIIVTIIFAIVKLNSLNNIYNSKFYQI